jgi:hypothetical protein
MSSNEMIGSREKILKTAIPEGEGNWRDNYKQEKPGLNFSPGVANLFTGGDEGKRRSIKPKTDEENLPLRLERSPLIVSAFLPGGGSFHTPFFEDAQRGGRLLLKKTDHPTDNDCCRGGSHPTGKDYNLHCPAHHYAGKAGLVNWAGVEERII